MNTLIAQSAASRARAASHKYLAFTLAGVSFGVAIEQVREIIEYRPPTIVPMMPQYLRGVLNLRGAMVPVIDLARRFGQTSAAVGRRTCIVIVEIEGWGGEGGNRLGVIVEAVNAVLDLPPSSIEAPPSFGTHIQADYLQGMGKIKDCFVLLLNLDRILSDAEIKVVQRASEEAEGEIVGGESLPPFSSPARLEVDSKAHP